MRICRIAVVLLVVSAAGAFGAGRAEVPAPEVALNLPETSYISPAASNGVQDELSWNVSITAAERMVVKAYRIVVSNAAGAEVYRRDVAYAENPRLLDRVLVGVGFARRKEPIAIPETLTWDGTATDGSDVPEGTYTVSMEGVDDKGRVGSSASYAVVVDNTAPSAEVSLPYMVFSPNGDGNKDILVLEQSGSTEALWTGTFTDAAGVIVSSFEWQSGSPQNMVWDGTGVDGQVAPDGVFAYTLSSTDLAGNSFSVAADGITINTQDTPISISRDVGVFSPNRDGAGDTVTFSLDVPVTDGVREWTLSVIDGTGIRTRTVTGETVPETFVFDGTGDGGDTLPEGSYHAELSVVYVNGNNPSARSTDFAVDLTPPQVSIVVDRPVFSPNGDGLADSLRIFQETSPEDLWVGTILDAEGNEVVETDWRVSAAPVFEWDGMDTEHATAPDGEYEYRLSSRDRAGNYAEALSGPIRIDTRETPVALTSRGTSFSPNADGIRDTIAFVPEIGRESGITRLVLTIADATGNHVRSFERTAAIPEISWNGRNGEGQNVPDGPYYAELAVDYDNGNKPTVRLGPILVDRRPPAATVAASTLIFSPDGDGSLDTLGITQTDSSSEDSWAGAFANTAGETVRTFEWTPTAESFVWDGTDESGNRVPDGVYTYVLSSTDKAGNTGSFRIAGITIDTRPTPVAVRIDGPAFSPNGDGVRDVLGITPVLEVTDNVEEWELEIVDSDGAVRRTVTGAGAVPGTVVFDGTDDRGQSLPEGSYVARLSVLYRNGRRPSESSPSFALDVTSPSASAAADVSLFSPNGDGRLDVVAVSQTGTREDKWTGVVVNAEGAPVRVFGFTGSPDGTVEWDGRDDDGNVVPDGPYRYSLSATDRGGNSGGSAPVTLVVDTRATSVSLTFAPPVISPNGDGIQDTLAITPVLAQDDGIRSYELIVEDAGGAPVRRFSGTDAAPQDITWDGADDQRAGVADGVYRARLIVEYLKGDRREAVTGDIGLDTTAPAASISASQRVFSPEGDGRGDTIAIRQSGSTETLWEGSIQDEQGNVVRSAYWAGVPEDYIWDGRDEGGSTVPDGTYRYELRATDEGGNSVRRTIAGIRVDTRVTSAFINPTRTSISPNDDGRDDIVEINIYPSLRDGVKMWSLVLLDDAGREVQDISTGSRTAVPASVVWDGRRTDGRVVDGEYMPRLTIEYTKGNLVQVEPARPILVDVSGPSFTLSTSPALFSPDGDGENDSARISIGRISDPSGTAVWEVDIIDPYDHLFYQRRGTGAPPPSFQWNGLSSSGELVQAAEDYVVRATLTDTLGNVRQQEIILPVDVLVLREGNDLKIRISSIQFAPNSAELTGLDPDVTERNLKTLTRLAEILRKYSDYQIRIEGHAVSVYWDIPTRAQREETEELQPLSEARAGSVKAELVRLGIPASRMTTEGLGGTQPIVPFSDLENRWKDRRVEFILIR